MEASTRISADGRNPLRDKASRMTSYMPKAVYA